MNDQTTGWHPFPPSWVNRLHRSIERLPGPTWVTYGLATGAFVALAASSDAFVPTASIAVPTAYGAVLTFFPIALIHYLDGVARECLRKFRPALGRSDPEVAQLSYELTNMPRGVAWIVSLVGVGFAFVGVLVAPEEMLGPPAMPDLLSALGFGVVLFGYASFAMLFYHSIRQLRLVSAIHSRATAVNLLQPQPLYAFSNLTVRTALALMLLSYYVVAISSGISIGPATLGLLAISLSLSILLFALPLYGMYARLREEKNRLMGGVSGRIEGVLDLLHRALGQPVAGEIDTLNKALASLMVERELILKSPTWPWTPGTVRAFASSALLPVALWLATRALESFLGP